MKRHIFSPIVFISVLTVLVACGESPDFLPGGNRFKIEIVSLTDGDVIIQGANQTAPASTARQGNYIFFRINGDRTKSSTLTLLIDLFIQGGDSVAHYEKTAPAVETDIPIEISPELAAGQYEIDLTLMQSDLLLTKEKRTFFLIPETLTVQSILSFPLVIFPSRTALLIAETNEPPGLNPYFKWTEGNKILAKGLLSDGYNQILWEAPKEEGVYSLKVEVFPFPPNTADDFKFKSPFSANAQMYISPLDKQKIVEQARSPRYDLFDIYISALKEREKFNNDKTKPGNELYPKNLKRPYPVIIGDTIGMRFNGQAGFICPELIFPVRTTPFGAFTLSLGMTLEGEQTGRQILSLITYDNKFSIDYFFDENGELVLRFKVNNEEFFFTSGIKKLEPGIRYLVEFSVTPAEDRLRTVWNLNGVQISETEKTVTVDKNEKNGYTVIGGENGIRCIIDTLDVILN